jgi:hypothetical protein
MWCTERHGRNGKIRDWTTMQRTSPKWKHLLVLAFSMFVLFTRTTLVELSMDRDSSADVAERKLACLQCARQGANEDVATADIRCKPA